MTAVKRCSNNILQPANAGCDLCSCRVTVVVVVLLWILIPSWQRAWHRWTRTGWTRLRAWLMRESRRCYRCLLLLLLLVVVVPRCLVDVHVGLGRQLTLHHRVCHVSTDNPRRRCCVDRVHTSRCCHASTHTTTPRTHNHSLTTCVQMHKYSVS